MVEEMTSQMEYSRKGLALTEGFEGCRLVAYQDSGGVWTIGFGHTRDVNPGDTCTELQALAWLLQDTQFAVDAVNRLVTVQLNQSEFDALVDFVFNCGTGNFSRSTMLKLLNEGQFQAAADELEKWDIAGGQVVAGLLRRRVAEHDEFLNPESEA